MRILNLSTLQSVLAFLLTVCLPGWIELDLYAAEQEISHYEFKAAGEEDEKLIFTPPGFDKVGQPAVADKENSGELKIEVVDEATGQPVFCRINVVGPDGNYYEPARNYLTKYSLTGVWPNWPKAWGNRPGKAPVRYFGRYFYSWGKATVKVPPGQVRIEVWKGFEYEPVTFMTKVALNETESVSLKLQHKLTMPNLGYYAGDPHSHNPGEEADDTQTIRDLMEAEDIRFGHILCMNDTRTYHPTMARQEWLQMKGLGPNSEVYRGDYGIVSGQEYRCGTYGHIKLLGAKRLVDADGVNTNPNNWPLFGLVSDETRSLGGYSLHAHGGYEKEIYADFAQESANLTRAQLLVQSGTNALALANQNPQNVLALLG